MGFDVGAGAPGAKSSISSAPTSAWLTTVPPTSPRSCRTRRSIRLRPGDRELGSHADGVAHRRAPLARWRPRGADGARPGVCHAGRARGGWSRHAQPGVRYRNARFMPDGQSLLALSDESGEVEFWRSPPTASAGPAADHHRRRGASLGRLPSPDGKSIAHHDTITGSGCTMSRTHKQTKVDESTVDAVPRHAMVAGWRMAGVRARPGQRARGRIWLYGGPVTRQGGGRSPPTASTVTARRSARTVQWLYFLSDRTFDSVVAQPVGQRGSPSRSSTRRASCTCSR